MDEHTNPNSSHPARRRLGRGLNALLGSGSVDERPNTPESTADPGQIDIDSIDRNPFQPRQDFEANLLDELVASIKQHGVLQPVLVRPHSGRYQLIAGERRWLAARKAGLETIPCRVLELDDQRVCEVAIEENLKRTDLNVLEKAQAFQDYLDRFSSSIEELSRQLSMNRSTVSNFLRLLELPDTVKQSLRTGKITSGHARALLPLEEADQIIFCRRVQVESLSVRQTEALVRAVLNRESEEETEATVPFPAATENVEKPEVNNHVRSLEQQLRDHLGAKVEIRVSGKDAGKIIIAFNSNDEFERILRQLRRAA